MRIAIYSRARDPSRGVGQWDMLRSQERRIKEWAAANGHQVVDDPFRDIGVSANASFREGLSTLLYKAIIGGHFDAIGVTEFARLSRDMGALSRLSKALGAVGVRLISIDNEMRPPLDFTDLASFLQQLDKINNTFRKSAADPPKN